MTPNRNNSFVLIPNTQRAIIDAFYSRVKEQKERHNLTWKTELDLLGIHKRTFFRWIKTGKISKAYIRLIRDLPGRTENTINLRIGAHDLKTKKNRKEEG